MRKQKLMTKALERKFKKFPFGSQEGKGDEAEVIVKFFNPYGIGTWLATEAAQQEDGDWLFFGLADLGFPEWGYFSLFEIQDTRVNVFGHSLPLERDEHCEGKTVGELRN